MRNFRLAIFALSLAVLGACQSNLTGPEASQEGYVGSGGQLAPVDATPVLTEGYVGSGG